jgi:hypothetical protein
MINTRQAVQAGDTPEKISISMITQDLKDGITKAEMSIKYSIKPWEVDEMFKHPLLKGKRPARKRTLSFSFVDDVTEDTSEPEFTKRETDLIEKVEVDPNQVTLEQAIDDAIETIENVKAEIVETERSVLDILSPTEFETSDNELEIPSFNDTLDLVEEQEMEAGTEEVEVEVEVEVEENEFDSFQL